MSGHSKWSTIKRQKGLNDKKRGITFTKLSNAISLAVKEGGGISDPDQNFRLRLSIDAARASNMPKDNIERAINRAVGKDAANFVEVIYEGFAPGGVAIMVEAATDNTMRTTPEIKSIFNKSGAHFGQPGSVSYQFKQIGKVVVFKNDKSLDEIFNLAVDCGAEDIEEAGDEVFIYTQVANISTVRQSLIDAGLSISEAGIVRVPVITTEITDKALLLRFEKFVNALEELDDVQKVYTNLL